MQGPVSYSEIMSYIDKIITGVLVFPLIAAVVTFPYAIFQYHKYGSVSKFRTLVIYSFILYLLISYFQIMLPLPARESTVGETLKGHLNLIPFHQVWLYWKGRIWSTQELLKYLKSFSLWQLLLNVVLTIPFGVYLRYYFKQDLKKTTLYSFLLSLFFELTQLTALYGIYPGPYRLADVEDLICNTLGGVIGYGIAALFIRILPDRDAIDRSSLIAGQTVSGMRRLWSALFDLAATAVLFVVASGAVTFAAPNAKTYTDYAWTYFLSWFCLFSLLQTLIGRGATLGHAICRMMLTSESGEKATAWQLIRRYAVLWLCTEGPILLGSYLTGGRFLSINETAAVVITVIARFYLILYVLNEIFRRGHRRMLHDRLSGTTYVSTLTPQRAEEK